MTRVTVLKGLPYGLDSAAAQAVRTWKFEPATLAGEPVAVYWNTPLSFSLDE